MVGGDYYKLYYKNPTCSLNLSQLSDVCLVSLHYSLLQSVLETSPWFLGSFRFPMRGQIASSPAHSKTVPAPVWEVAAQVWK